MNKHLVDFFYEVGQLARIPRGGTVFAGVANPESDADHICRTAIIAYALAKLEGADAERAATIALFHELPETRIGDLHKVQQKYITNKKEIERKVLVEQVEHLPAAIKEGIIGLVGTYEDDSSPEEIIVRDADFLEMILQAKEHMEKGYAAFQNWADNATKCLKTDRAKQLAKEIIKTKSTDWYEHLKRIER